MEGLDTLEDYQEKDSLNKRQLKYLKHKKSMLKKKLQDQKKREKEEGSAATAAAKNNVNEGSSDDSEDEYVWQRVSNIGQSENRKCSHGVVRSREELRLRHQWKCRRQEAR